ncbi:metapyrocatechase [Pseudomonas chlororaphis]|uniref:Metapyrocatechase n=1 Tax=Pseudomonas chlororaphis TaxID=587753 RepID=A0AB34C9K8_9PSED|nr:VOC family protein [Pseudomonas chlororaphis]KAA5842466.1 metapyrocatechase [Pseudomonas chlororaphis]
MSSEPCGVHSLDHYALYVPSLSDARLFFGGFGLDVIECENGLNIKASDGHVWARILNGNRKSLAHLSFNCFGKDFDALHQQVELVGARFEIVNDSGFWFRDPDNNLVQVKIGEKHMPNAVAETIETTKELRGAVTRDKVVLVKPRRLSHVLLFSPDVQSAVSFYIRALGLKLSDHSQDIIAFIHARHGCDHHLVAFCKSTSKGFHHAAWDVENIDQVGNGAQQMAAAGYQQGWGVGRHCLGSNYFYYVRDPWGSFCEYSAHMDFIDAGVDWPAGDYPPENSLYLWGPDVPDYFVVNSEES